MLDIVRLVRHVRLVRIVQGVRIVLIVLAALIQSDGRTHAQGSGILGRHRAPTEISYLKIHFGGTD